jgi:hypothetical protein
VICARCQEPRKDAEVRPIDIDASTGAGITIYLCRDYNGCKPVPSQITPHSTRH